MTDAYGNTAVPAIQTVQVHETAPTISIDAVEGNNTITPAEAAQGVDITGQTNGIADGTTVHVTVYNSNGTRVGKFNTTDSGDSYTVHLTPAQVQSQPAGTYTLHADVTDSYGNVAQEASDTVTLQGGSTGSARGYVLAADANAGLIDVAGLLMHNGLSAASGPSPIAPELIAPASSTAEASSDASDSAAHLATLSEHLTVMHDHALGHLIS